MAAEFTAGEPVTCKAAVCWAAGEECKIEDVVVAAPQEGEVRIRLFATAICHTDEYTRSGQDGEAMFPCILGHEGCGLVVDVGPNVTSVAVGDKVIPLYIPECGECKFCRSEGRRRSNLCSRIRSTQGQGVMPNGTSRFTCNGQTVYHYMGTSTFSEYTVVAEISVAKIPDAAPMNKVCLLGCGITTGYGAVVNTMQVDAGSVCAVFGLGGVGLAVIMGLASVNAGRIIAVDTNPAKFERAIAFGATDCVNPLDHGDTPIQQVLTTMTADEDGVGGVDFSFECIGNINTMRAALECCHKGWGESCIIGVAPAGTEISTRPFQLVTGRHWRGTAFGGTRGRTQLPGYVQEYMDGNIKVDEFITHEFPFEEIAAGFEAMHSGEAIRPVLNIVAPDDSA
mmetsp:Transcript_5904/g.11169  ORF Transcript_5904/g.11169 Transcript_5904/m.11169 type:complete len:396 (+) Transcript_5904:8-1195(+)